MQANEKSDSQDGPSNSWVAKGGWVNYSEFKPRVKYTAIVAVFAFMPIIIISLLGQRYASIFKIPIEFTNFQAVLSMMSGVFHLRDHGDSWVPMVAALRTLSGISGEEIYKTLFLAYNVPLVQPPSGPLPGADEGIYKTLFFAYGIRFQYPLTSLLPLDLLSQLGPLGRSELTAINFAIYCVNAAGCGWLCVTLFRSGLGNHRVPDRLPDPLGMALLAVLTTFLFYPTVRAVVLGQIQVWIDALFTCALICWIYNRKLAAGILIGLACAIKPQLGLLLIWGLLWREMRFSFGIVAVLVPLATFSLWRYGLQNHLAYLDVLAFLGRHGEIYFANNSVNGILNAYFSGRNNMVFDLPGELPDVPIVYWGTLTASVLALGPIIIPPLWRRGERPDIVDFGAASICTVIGSPVAWEHHYGILLPLYFIGLRTILGMAPAGRRLFAVVTLGVSWILVADFIPFAHLFAQTPFRFVQAHCFFGALLLLALLLFCRGGSDLRVAAAVAEKDLRTYPDPRFAH